MNTDKQLVKERFEHSFARYDQLATVQRRICDRLAASLSPDSTVSRGLEIGIGTGFLTARLVEKYPAARWFLNDLVPVAGDFTSKFLSGVDHSYLWGDAEELDFPSGLDLVASASTVQWFDDLKAFFCKSAAALEKGGVLLFSTFGPDNFHQMRECTGTGLRYFTLSQIGQMLEESGFKVQWSEEYKETLCFAEPGDVLQYIKALGINSVRKTRWGKDDFGVFESKYRQLFPCEKGGVSLTYHPMLIRAVKK